MYDNYGACVAFVRQQEGGNTDTPGDRGGRTGRGGITHTVYDAYRTAKGLPVQDVWLISNAEIAEIYAKEYWAPIHGDELAGGVDLCIFDYAINSGPRKANWERLQAVAQGATDSVSLIHKICADRLSFMRALGSWKQFGADWGRRVAECEALALKMAGELTPQMIAAAAGNKAAAAKATNIHIVAGGAALAGAHQYLPHSLLVLAGIAAVFGLFAAMNAFAAKRQGQRADALAAAVKAMQDARSAAAKAVTDASAQAEAKAKAIEADQAALDAAKAEIGKV